MSSPTDPPYVIDEPRAAALLIEPDERRYFEPFLGRERTIAEAAREIGAHPNSVLYRVRRMLEVGLLAVVRERERAGRPIRVYRAVADRVFVPYVASPAVDLLEVLLQERAAIEETMQRALLHEMRQAHDDRAWGLLLYRERDGMYAYDAVEPGVAWHAQGPDDPAILDHFVALPPLTHAQAKTLQAELLDVLKRYTRTPDDETRDGSARPYLLRVVLAPEPPDTGEA